MRRRSILLSQSLIGQKMLSRTSFDSPPMKGARGEPDAWTNFEEKRKAQEVRLLRKVLTSCIFSTLWFFRFES